MANEALVHCYPHHPLMDQRDLSYVDRPLFIKVHRILGQIGFLTKTHFMIVCWRSPIVHRYRVLIRHLEKVFTFTNDELGQTPTVFIINKRDDVTLMQYFSDFRT